MKCPGRTRISRIHAKIEDGFNKPEPKRGSHTFRLPRADPSPKLNAVFPRVAFCLLAFHLVHGEAVAASAPAVLNYHGRVSVDGRSFNGIADFWYAAGRPSHDWTLYDDPAKSSTAATTTAGAATEGYRPAPRNC